MTKNIHVFQTPHNPLAILKLIEKELIVINVKICS